MTFDGWAQSHFFLPIFNLIPPHGAPARLGFDAVGVVVILDASLRSESDYGVSINVLRNSQALAVTRSEVELWGTPAAPVNDAKRVCEDTGYFVFGCSAGVEPKPFLRMPTSCTPPGEGLTTTMRASSWQDPFDFTSMSLESHLAPNYPSPPEDWGAPQGTTACDDVPFGPEIELQPSAHSAETSSGLKVEVEVDDPGLSNSGAIAEADVRKATVTLPQGVTVNPSQAEGLGVCTPAQYKSETVTSLFGQGCPGTSKIGSVRIDTPLLDEPVEGNLFIAQQDDPTTSAPGAENPFDSLLAVYIVAKSPELGILVKLPGEVETDERSGRIVTTFDDLPQLPFSKFTLKFREGARAPLVTPEACGTYTTEAEFVPWSAADPDNPTAGEIVTTTSSFTIDSGVGGGPCPSGGVPSFNPGFEAGMVNPNAGSYSPTNMRLTRLDGEQNLTKFSATLPPGLLAKLAGVEKCSDAAIAAADDRTGRLASIHRSHPALSEE